MTEQAMRALPFLGMPWVTWRQHRLALAGLVGVLGGLSLVLLVSGLLIHHAYRGFGLDHCPDLSVPACAGAADDFYSETRDWENLTAIGLLPPLIGMFVGGPLLARELETGTFRFAWTQGVDRTRWLVTKLALLGLAIAAAALAFSALFAWWHAPFTRIGGRIDPGAAYEVEGVVFAARSVFAFALGTLIGAVLRRTVAAMAATGVASFAVLTSIIMFLRPHLVPPVTGVVPGNGRAQHTEWVLRWGLVGPGGHRLSAAEQEGVFRHLAAVGQNEPLRWLLQHGYTQWETYQPDGRFWALQSIEAGTLCLLALALAAASLYLIRRRTV